MSFSAVPDATRFDARATREPRYCRIYSSRHSPALWALAIAISILSNLAPSITHADVTIEPRVGFHGIFQLGRPFPLEI